MKTLDFSDIISHVKFGETPDNKEFQPVLQYKDPKDPTIKYVPTWELREFFYYFLYFGHNYNREKIYSYLDYHLSKFKGDKIDFIDFLKREIQPDRLKKLASFKDTYLRDTNIIPVNEIINDWINKHIIVSNEPTTTMWAYYYHILHTVNPKTRFENDPLGKMKAFESIAIEKGISPKGFQLKYNELENKPETRCSAKQIRILQSVIQLFTDNPVGLSLAKEYLKKAEGYK